MLVGQLINEQGLKQKQALVAVGLGRSTYHYRSKKRCREYVFDTDLCAAIRAIHERAPVYGYRKIWAKLRALGWHVNHKRVLRYLRHLGLLQPRKVKGQVFTRPALTQPTVSNTYWEEDLTYVWCGNQNGYLFVLIDGYDKALPGEHFGDRCRSEEAAGVLERAVLKRFGGRLPEGHRLVLRIDRGPQFTAQKFRETARMLGVILEYAGIQCPDDKPYIEAFISKYKIEEVYRHEYQNISEAKAGWELYRTWYENERIHQTLDYQTPSQVWESQKMALANKPKMCNINQASLCPK